MVKEIPSDAHFASTLKSSPIVVVDFFATWCGPCKVLAPKLDVCAAKYKSVGFWKADADVCTKASSSYNISSLPTMILFKHGQEVGRVIGANIVKLEELLQKHM
jgi:thioredoxin 1